MNAAHVPSAIAPQIPKPPFQILNTSERWPPEPRYASGEVAT